MVKPMISNEHNANMTNDLKKIVSDDSLLHFLLDKCKMTVEDAESEIEDMKNKVYLENHKFNVWQGKDGRWRTYLPDESNKDKRKMIAKGTREKLDSAVISYYKGVEDKTSERRVTLRTFYQTWLDYKKLKTTSSIYIRRIHNDWEKYYLDDPLIDVPLQKLTYDRLEEWALKKIRTNELTKKQYYNMTVIIRQSLEYAVQKDIIAENPFSRVSIDRKLFHSEKKPADETQVFLTDEQPLIEKEAYKDFQETGDTACLAVPFLYQTGLRLGEIVALKESDITGKYLHIQRTETKQTEQNPDGSWKPIRYAVVGHTKSEAGDRLVYLSSTARTILQLVIQSNQEHGYYDNGYLFLNANGRIHGRSVDTRIRKYCRYIGIDEKSSHKARKTYISSLIDAGVNINEIRRQVGHEDERTTYRNYCFNRMPQSETENMLEKVLAHRKAEDSEKCNHV